MPSTPSFSDHAEEDSGVASNGRGYASAPETPGQGKSFALPHTRVLLAKTWGEKGGRGGGACSVMGGMQIVLVFLFKTGVGSTS